MISDEQIISLYFDRSQEAIAQTDLKYGKYCSAIAWRILYSQEDTEECVSDTWLKTWDAIPPQKPLFLRAFLGKITRNLALNRYESAHAQKRGSGSAQTATCLDELGECIPDDLRSQEVEDVADRLALTQILNRFMGTLGEEERRFFLQRYWYALSVKEIAEENGVGLSKVKMSLMRTRDKLKVHLQKEGVSV